MSNARTGVKSLAELLKEMETCGQKVRKLKSEKAEFELVKTAVEDFIEARTRYETAKDAPVNPSTPRSSSALQINQSLGTLPAPIEEVVKPVEKPLEQPASTASVLEQLLEKVKLYEEQNMPEVLEELKNQAMGWIQKLEHYGFEMVEAADVRVSSMSRPSA